MAQKKRPRIGDAVEFHGCIELGISDRDTIYGIVLNKPCPEDTYSPFVIYTKGEVFTDSCDYDSAQGQLTCLKWGYLLSTKEGK